MERKMKFFANLKKGILTASCAVAALLVSSCEIGLGKAVDTLPPEASITGPSTNSILRDKFVVFGECSDDMGVKEVTVELKNTELDKTYEMVTVIPENNKWSVTLNEMLPSGEYPYGDGKYDITVHSYDLQGKDSGPRNISIVIDNTPPLMVLTRPSNGDKYGQKFDITGQVADDSNIDLVEVSVFSKETNELLQTIQLKNVPPTIDLSAAVFGDEAYSKIYGSEENKNDGDKEYYCEIKAYDAARKFPEEAGDKGNETSFFYMYDDIYDLLNNFKLTELYHIQNGLYARSADSSASEALNKLRIPSGEEGSIQTKRNAFVLNPLNNPTYELSGYQSVITFSELENKNDYKIKNEGKITIKVNVGRDSTPLKQDTIKVFAKRVTGQSQENIDRTKNPNGWIFPENEKLVQLYPFEGNTIVTNGSNREITIDMSQKYDGLVFGETYIFEVEGKDQDGNDIFNNGTDYGFYYKTSDKAPTLSLTEPSSTVYLKENGKIKVKGNVYHEEGKSDVTVELVKYQTEEEIQRDGQAEPTKIPLTDLVASDNLNTKYDFDTEIAVDKFIPSAELNVSNQYTFSIYAELGDNKSSPIERTVMYDVVKPEITVSSVSPVADTSGVVGGKEYNVNGKITIKVSVNDEDTGIARAAYKYNGNEIPFTKFTNNSISLDTNELTDKHDLDFVIVAEDKAGNSTEYTLVYDDGDPLTSDPKYYVDQSTDEPLILIEATQITQVTEYTPGCDLTTLSKKHTITGKITDDDGLDNYTISLYIVDSESGDESPTNVEDFGDTIELNGIYEKMISKQMPNENNIYKLVITATDKKKEAGETPVTTTWESYVKVAGDAPFVSVTSGNKSPVSKTGTKNKLELAGRFSGAHTPGENENKHLKIYLLKKEDSKKSKEYWTEIFDAHKANYGADAVTKDWSCSIPVADLPLTAEGEHTVIIRIVDGNGRATDDEISYIVDSIPPELKGGSITIDGNAYSQNGWSKKTKFPIVAEWIESETASGMDKINVWVNTSPTTVSATPDETYYDAKQQSENRNEYKFEKTITDFPDGENYLHLQAVDKAENKSEVAHFRIGVDTKEPVVTIDQTEILSNGKDVITITGTVTDTNKESVIEKASGLNTWAALRVFKGDVPLNYADWKVGDTNADKVNHPANEIAFVNALNGTRKSDDGSDGAVPYGDVYVNEAKFKITLDPKDANVALNSDGEYTLNFVALDQPENRGKASVKVHVDTIAPTMEIKSTTTLLSANGKENNVNGTFTLSGASTDADKVQSTELKIYTKSDYEQNPRGNAISNDGIVTSPASSSATNWTYVIDTTKLTDTTEYVLVVTSTDRTGNPNEITQNIYVDQSTDKPKITPTNADDVDSADGLNVTAQNPSGKNIFGTTSNNVFTATISDDDGIDATKLVLKYSTDETNWTTVQSTSYTFANSTLKWTLPLTEGKYLLKIEVEDNKKETKLVTGTPYKNDYSTWVGVSAGAPTIAVASAEGQFRSGKDAVSAQEMEITGTWRGGSGTTVERTVSGTGVTLKDETADPLFKSDKTWTDKVYAYASGNAEVTVTYTATDMFGQKGTATYTYKLDNIKPSIKTVTPETAAAQKTVTVNETQVVQNWYSSNAVTFTVKAEDANTGDSGVSTVEYKKAGDSAWNQMTPTATAGTYTGTIIFGNQGENTVYFRTTDKAGNSSSETSTSSNVYVDTKVPTVSFDAEDIRTNGKTSIVIKGTLSDSNKESGTEKGSGLNAALTTLRVFKGDVPSYEETAVSPSGQIATATVTGIENNFEVTINPETAGLNTSGDYTLNFVVIDAVKNRGRGTIKVYVDSEKPEVKTLEVTDLITTTGSGARTDNVNGKITLKGTVTDNDVVKETTVEIWKDGATTATYTHKTTETCAWPFIDQSKTSTTASQFTYVIDTTKLSDTTLYTVKVKSVDRSGNPSDEKTATFYVNQATDKPVITPTNAEDVDSADGLNVTADNPIGKNIFGTTSNNVFRATITDDDGIDTSKLTLKYSTNGSDWTDAENYSFSNSNLTWTLPSIEGKYKVQIDVEDNKKETTSPAYKASYTTWIGVSAGVPTVTVTTPAGQFKKGKDNGTAEVMELTGIWTGESGITLTRTVTGATLKTGNADAPTKVAGGTWTDSIAAYNSENATVTVTYTATDMFGQKGTATYTYKLDNANPKIKSKAPAAATVTIGSGDDAKKWYDTTAVNYTIVAEDTGDSGISKVQYKKNSEGTWNDMTPTSTAGTYTGTVILAQQGKNVIYFRAVDAVGNSSSDSSVSDTIYIDTKQPDDITLKTLDGAAYTGRKLANGQNDISVVVTVKDVTALTGTDSGKDASGISKVELIYDGTVKTDVTGTPSDDDYTLKVSKELISDTDKSMVQVGVKVTDNVGNEYDKTLFALNIDNVGPSDIKISELMDAAPASEDDTYTVNKTFTVSGTASDNQSLEKVELQYMIKGESGYANEATDSNWTTYTVTSGDSETSVLGSYTWSASIDSTSATFNGKTFKIRLKATDSAGNVSYGPLDSDGQSAAYPEIIVDQDTDIPVITVDGMKANGTAFISQKKITGSVEDDDGNINFTNFKVSEDGSNWNSVTQLGTSRWSYTLASDGSYTLYFKVTDAANTEFSNSTIQKIKITGDDNTASTTGTLRFTVDTQDPDVSADLYKGETKLETQETRRYSAPVNTNAVLKITANDANGLKEIGAYFGDRASDDSNVTKITTGLVNNQEKTLNLPLPTDSDLQAARVITYYATDNSERTSSHTYTVTVDNVAPTITVSNPSSTYTIAGDTTVSGTTGDGEGGTGIESVKWFIPTNQQIEAWNKTGDEAMKPAEKDALFANIINGTNTWAIAFEADSAAGKLQQFFSSYTDDDGEIQWHNYISEETRTATYGTKVDGSRATYDLPIYFRIEDKVGNVTYYTDYTARVNPDGDRPTAAILYPTLKEDPTTHVVGPDTLSGSIRVNGEANDEVDAVAEIYLEIQKSTDNSNSTDESKWETVTGYDKVKATGTYKWNYSFDSSETGFAPTGDSTVTYLRFRVWAVDEKGLVGDKSDWTVVKTDKNSPLIGSKNKFKVVKYSGNTAGNTVLSSLDYEEGMYVSGTVFLEFSVEDESGLKEISVGTNSMIKSVKFVPKGKDAVTVVTTDTGTDHTNQPEVSKGYYGYDKVRVEIETTGSGSLSFTVRAVENTTTNLSSSREIKLRYDNTAPGLESLKHGGDDVGIGSGKVTVKQSNSSYALKSVINENDSGMAQLFMFWSRTVSGTENRRVYDPRKSENNVFYAYTGTGIIKTIDFNSDGLPYRRYASQTITGKNTFTLSAADPFLTVANYVLIDGSYRKITAISDDKKTYTFSPVTDAATTNVDAIYAIAIDNERTEASNLSIGDDGDGIWESLVDAGTTYDWEMNFNSLNIPDGPLTISCLAFDAAGNKSALQETETKVENHAPRIAKVRLGTDLNKDKTISKEELTVYDRYKEENNLADVADLSSEVALDTNGFTVKSGFAIIPEFVGGNVGTEETMKMVLKRRVDGMSGTTQTYTTYQDPDTSDETGTTGDLMVSEFAAVANVMTSIYTPVSTAGTGDERSLLSTKTSDTRDRVNSTFRKFFLTNAQLFGTGTIDNTPSGSSEKIGLTFWDATEETVQGTDSQTAVLYLTNMKYEMVDKVPPKVVIKPFKWVSKDDNSLYNNSTSNGHIELEGDLLGGTWTGYTSDAPKVSGKVTFRGTAYDNVGLTQLKFAFGSSSDYDAWIADNITATYADGSWTLSSEGTMDTDYWALRVYDVIHSTSTEDAGKRKNFTSSDAYFGQQGHKVAWEFDLDTEKWTNSGTNPAALGAKLTVTAIDNSTDNTTTSDKHNYSSTDASTSAQEGTLTGVELDRVKNKSVYVVDVVPYITKVTTGRSAFNTEQPSVFSRSAKGRYGVRENEVIGIEGFNLGTTRTVSLNGTTLTGSGTGYSVGTTARTGDLKVTVNLVDSINNNNSDSAEYNMCPNGINNDTLNDDTRCDVWEFAIAAKPQNGAAQMVTMKINPSRGDPGFSYANSVLYFNMPAYESNNGNTKKIDGKGWDQSDYPYFANATVDTTKYRSQMPVGMNYGGFSYNTFAYDSHGYSYGAAMCTDTQNAYASGNLQFFSREAPCDVLNMDQNMNYANSNNASRLDMSTLQTHSSDSEGYETDINRIQSLSMETSFSGGVGTAPTDAIPTYIFMAYYDRPVKQVRFRWGTVGGKTDAIDGKKNNPTNYTSAFNTDRKGAYGLNDINDEKYTGVAQGKSDDGGCRPSKVGDSFTKYSNTNNSGIPVQIVAASGLEDWGTNNTALAAYKNAKNGGAGQYVALGIADKDTANPKAVVVWYDAVNMKLRLAYNNAPLTSNTWTSYIIDEDGGSNVKMAVDGDNGIHLAYYDNIYGSDLKYCYIQDYDAATEAGRGKHVVKVDSYGGVGAKCTIDVVKEGTGAAAHWVPYISYQMNSYLGTPLAAKMAYCPGWSNTNVPAGVNGEKFTGDWEVTFVPTSNIANDDTINIGFWKDSNGAAKTYNDTSNAHIGVTYSVATNRIANSIMAVGSPTNVKGNNSAYPIIGYGIDKGWIEVAQKR